MTEVGDITTIACAYKSVGRDKSSSNVSVDFLRSPDIPTDIWLFFLWWASCRTFGSPLATLCFGSPCLHTSHGRNPCFPLVVGEFGHSLGTLYDYVYGW